MNLPIQARTLYRQCLRLARSWPGPSEEKAYIYNEALTLFKRNSSIHDEEIIKAKLFEAESRIELARHYRIPYPRPYHYGRSPKTHGFEFIESAYMHTQDDFFRTEVGFTKPVADPSSFRMDNPDEFH